jgi:hypothetical protein
MIGVFVALSLGGNWIDQQLNLKFPYFTLLGLFIALSTIFYSLYAITIKNSKNNPE